METKPKGFLINESPVYMAKPEVIGTKPDGCVRIKAVLQDADQRNRNKRIYPKDVLQRALQSEYVRERLATKTFYGEAGHPLAPTIQRQLYMDQSNISHIVTEVWWEGNKLMGIVESANTARGKDFAGLVQQGCKVGFSLRAVGPVTEKRGDTVIVKDPLTIFSYDWVIHPSHAAAYMTEIMSESGNLLENTSSILAESTFEPYFDEADVDGIISKNMKVIMNESNPIITEDKQTVFFKHGNDVMFTDRDTYITETVKNYSFSKALKLNEDETLSSNENDSILSEQLTNAFYDAVKNGEVSLVRIMMKDSLLIDPTFKQFEEMRKAASGLKGLFEEHDGRDFKEQSDWNDDYMNREMVRIVNNFSHERVNHLKKVVSVLRKVEDAKEKATEAGKEVKKEDKEKFIKKVGSHIARNKGKYAVGALAAAGIGAAGYAGYKALKKRNAKKVEEEKAKNLEECMIDIFEENGELFILEEDMDFLLEACDYTLSEGEILENIETEILITEAANAEVQQEAKRLFNLAKSMMSSQVKAALASTKDKQVGFVTDDDVTICEISYEDYCDKNKFTDEQEERIFEEMEEEVAEIAKKLNSQSKFKIECFELDNIFSIIIKINRSSIKESYEYDDMDDITLDEDFKFKRESPKHKLKKYQQYYSINDTKHKFLNGHFGGGDLHIQGSEKANVGKKARKEFIEKIGNAARFKGDPYDSDTQEGRQDDKSIKKVAKHLKPTEKEIKNIKDDTYLGMWNNDDENKRREFGKDVDEYIDNTFNGTKKPNPVKKTKVKVKTNKTFKLPKADGSSNNSTNKPESNETTKTTENKPEVKVIKTLKPAKPDINSIVLPKTEKKENKPKDDTKEVETDNTTSTDNKTKESALKKVGEHIARNKGKYAIGALAAAGIGAAGYAGYKALKKRNDKKKEAEKAKNLEECMIYIFEESGELFILEEDMDFLLEACDYTLSENEILENIETILEAGVAKANAEQVKLNSLKEDEEFDYEDDEMLSEGFKSWFIKKKITRLERELDEAIAERKRMDTRFKNKKQVAVTVRDETTGTTYDFATSSPKLTKTYTDRVVYRDVEDVKAEQDDKIEDLKEEIERLRKKLNKSESSNLEIYGDELNEGFFSNKNKEREKRDKQKKLEEEKVGEDFRKFVLRQLETKKYKELENLMLPYKYDKLYSTYAPFIFDLDKIRFDEVDEVERHIDLIQDLKDDFMKTYKGKVKINTSISRESNTIKFFIFTPYRPSNEVIGEGFFDFLKKKKDNKTKKVQKNYDEDISEEEIKAEARRLFAIAKNYMNATVKEAFEKTDDKEDWIGHSRGDCAIVMLVDRNNDDYIDEHGEEAFDRFSEKLDMSMQYIAKRLQEKTDYVLEVSEETYWVEIDVKRKKRSGIKNESLNLDDEYALEEGFFFDRRKRTRNSEEEHAKYEEMNEKLKPELEKQAEKLRQLIISKLSSKEYSQLAKTAGYLSKHNFEDFDYCPILFDISKVVNLRSEPEKAEKYFHLVKKLKNELQSKFDNRFELIMMDGDWDDPYGIGVRLRNSSLHEAVIMVDGKKYSTERPKITKKDALEVSDKYFHDLYIEKKKPGRMHEEAVRLEKLFDKKVPDILKPYRVYSYEGVDSKFIFHFLIDRNFRLKNLNETKRLLSNFYRFIDEINNESKYFITEESTSDLLSIVIKGSYKNNMKSKYNISSETKFVETMNMIRSMQRILRRKEYSELLEFFNFAIIPVTATIKDNTRYRLLMQNLKEELQETIDKRFKLNVTVEDDNVTYIFEIIPSTEFAETLGEAYSKDSFELEEGFSFNFFKNKKMKQKNITPAEKKQKQLEAKKEAERLFPKAKAMFGPALNKGFNNDAASDHLIADINGNDVTIVCVGFSDFQDVEKDEDPEFVKLLDKAEAEIKHIVEKLQAETDFKVGWFEDDFNYFLTIDIKK